MVFFMIIVAGLMTLLIFGDDNLVDKRSYCLANSNENNAAVILISMAVLSASDVCTAILDVMIYYVTWKRMKCKLQGYNLSTKFQLQETQVSMRLIIPFSIIHSSAYFMYTMIVIFSNYYTMSLEHQQKVQTLQVVSMSKSFYLSGVPILIFVFRLKNNRKIDEWLSNQNYAEVYFQLFKNQIN
ncbi:hypothetical protein M3Y95_00895300 [Aphelenchoides besseyi]|nr:hypothetical protein M3Y95_00895300 [Aphelenchoides besseyi]